MMRYPLFILAGGQSRRFGSDKARAPFEHHTLIEHVASCLAPMVSRTTVVSKPTRSYEDLGLRTITDPETIDGPVAGIMAALQDIKRTNNKWGWVVSCDLVRPNPSLGELLLCHAHAPHQAVMFFKETIQPLFALYHVDALDELKVYCQQHTNPSIRQWIQTIPTKFCTPPETWSDVRGCNTPQDLYFEQGTSS